MSMFEVYFHDGNPHSKRMQLVAASSRNKAGDRVKLRAPLHHRGNRVILEVKPVDEFSDCVYMVNQTLRHCRFKIVQCSSPDYGYKDRIGDEFTGSVFHDFLNPAAGIVNDVWDSKNAKATSLVIAIVDIEIIEAVSF